MTITRCMTLLACGAILALPLLSGGEARAQTPAACTATATVSDAADSDNVYTTTLACTGTTDADGAVDYTHLPYYSQGRTGSGHRDTGITNNNQKNHLSMTIGDGVVFSGMNAGSGASDQRTLVLESEGDLTFTVEAGGVIRANQMLPNNRWNVGAGLYLVTDTGDLTVKHAGVIELDHSFPSTAVFGSDPSLSWNEFGSDGNGISVVAADRHFYAASTYNANGGNGVNGGDILIELASTGVIRNKAGSAGGNGIDARQRTELGDIRIDLAAGSTIDVSAEGGRGVLGQIFKQRYYDSAESVWKDSPDPQSGDIIINARGTIKAAVKRKSGSRYQGAGIVALSTSSGAIRIASSGTIETTQAPAILAWPSGAGNPVDDPDTPAIEGNLIDVAGGRIRTRGNSAIFAQFGTGSNVMTVRVAEGATVRAEGMAGPGAITKAQYESCNVEARLGCRYAEGARPRNRGLWWIRSDEDNNGEFDTILPFVNGITVQGIAAPAEGVASRVLIDGVVEVVEGSPVTADENDEELGYAGGHGVYLSHGGMVVVGGTGRISVSTASGAAIHSETGDLAVAVTGTVGGDIRGLGSGEHTVTVNEGGAVTGTISLVGSSAVRADGAVGSVRLDSGGTVTVGRTGRITGISSASDAAIHSETGDLDVAVTGTVGGDIRGLGSGEHTVTVSEGGAVGGTIRLVGSSAVRADGAVGSVRLDSGGTVTVGRTGRITGISSASDAAIHSETGDLDVAVTGTVGGDIRGLGSGEHTVTVNEGGAVGGTIRLAGSSAVRADGAVGSVRLDSGGTVTVGRTGRITGISGASDAAIHSVTGDLDVAVTGTVDGDIRGLGSGEHTVTVSEGGAVTGTISLAGSSAVRADGAVGSVHLDSGGTVTVSEGGAVTGTISLAGSSAVRADGAVGSVRLDSGGMVTVGRTGRITGISSASDAAIHSVTGDLDVAVTGTVDGDIRGLGSGEHTVTVNEGGTVTGTISLAGSTVRVDGAVGSVRLDSGGMVTVGRTGRITGISSASDAAIHSETGDLDVAVTGTVGGDIQGLGSGEHMVKVNEGGAVTGTIRLAGSSTVRMDGAVGSVRLDSGGMVTVGRNGRITNAEDGISSASGELTVVIEQAADEPAAAAGNRAGRIVVEDGGQPRVVLQEAGEKPQELGKDWVPSGAFDVELVRDASGGVRAGPVYTPRSRVYEALPSVLLGLNVLPTHRERLAAARSPNGAWARVWAAGGERKAESSTSTPRLSYDHNRSGVRLGVDIPLGEDAVGGVSAHHVRGKADLSGGDGKIEATGTGLDVSGAWRFDDGVYVDAQASATWYEADLTSRRGPLKSGTRGFGYALGLETGRRIGLGPGPLGDLTATPRARLVRSEVDMDDFTDDLVGSRVSLERGRSVTGRAGVNLEALIEGGGLLFGSVEVEREFASKTRIDVAGSSLASEPEAMRARIELGGSYAWDGGAYALKGAAHVVQGRSDNRDWGGGLSLAVRF